MGEDERARLEARARWSEAQVEIERRGRLAEQCRADKLAREVERLREAESARAAAAGAPADRDRIAAWMLDRGMRCSVVRCRACGAKTRPYYYFINVGHPAIARMWKEWRRRHGLRDADAAGDAQRLAFEVSLLREEVCQALQRQMEAGA